MSARVAWVAVAIATGGALLAAEACDDSVRSHVFSGRQYEDARDCLDDPSSIDVVDGPEPGACDPKCIVAPPDPDSGIATLYISTMCPPLPPAPFDTTGTDPRCSYALLLYNQNVTCLSDGGIANPLDAAILLDAGPGADADAGAVADANASPDAADSALE